MTSSRVSYVVTVVLSGTFLHHLRPSRLAALPFFTARIERRPKGIPGAVDSGGFSLHSMAARRVGRTFLFSWRGIPFRTWRQLVLNHRNVGNELSAWLGMPRCQWIHGMATCSTHFHDRNRIRMAWIGPLIFWGRKPWTRRALDPFGLRSSQQNPIHWCSKIIASQQNDISTTGCISCHLFFDSLRNYTNLWPCPVVCLFLGASQQASLRNGWRHLYSHQHLPDGKPNWTPFEKVKLQMIRVSAHCYNYIYVYMYIYIYLYLYIYICVCEYVYI